MESIRVTIADFAVQRVELTWRRCFADVSRQFAVEFQVRTVENVCQVITELANLGRCHITFNSQQSYAEVAICGRQ